MQIIDLPGDFKPPKRCRLMTVHIDLSNSNPSTCCTYDDDALSMVKGSADWDEFFGHRPCLFKDGKVVGYLNPNDFSKFEDGTPTDITSGNAGDVMIEFPRRGLVIETVGNILTVKMTDDVTDASFKYYAHQRGAINKDYFYIGAYLGYNLSSKLRSLSGRNPTVNTSYDGFRSYAHNLGKGYDMWAYYQLIYIQSMYTLKYANLNSQSVIGKGYYASSSRVTGGTNIRGMDFGSLSNTEQVKLFGLEDFWGNCEAVIDGWYLASDGAVKTATDNFNSQGIGYGIVATISTSQNGGVFLKKPIGTSEGGYFSSSNGGSTTTYFCDKINYGVSSGTSYPSLLTKTEHYKASDPNDSGVFSLYSGHVNDGSVYNSARLMYL